MIKITLSLELKVGLEIIHLKYSNNHSADKAFNTLTYFEHLYIKTLEICKHNTCGIWRPAKSQTSRLVFMMVDWLILQIHPFVLSD